jgi:signal transduction histidine kinase
LLSRWHWPLYALVIFAVFAVARSLYLSHQYTRIYSQSVAVNQAWTDRLRECAQLGQLAVAVNAPGNDVFQSHQVAEEEAKLQGALRQFNERLDTLEDALRTVPGPEEAAGLLGSLQTVRRLIQEMAEEAQGLFAQLRSGHTRQAGEKMAAMDRGYARANQALERLREQITAIQGRHLEDQAAVAASLERFEYVVSPLVLLLIAGAMAYGHRARRQVEAATREKEGYIEALRDSEAQLHRRVRERTSELVHLNESLHNEVEERRRAEQALRQSEGRYRSLVEVRRQLLQKLLFAQEDERRRIARDLHDEIGQALTALLIGLRTVVEASTLESARGHANDLRRITLSALEEVRRLARGLRPSVLDDLGLTAALERYVADYAQAHGLGVTVEGPGPAARRLPEEVETALYRIAQEALTNTAKHAAATQVRIVVDQQPGFVQLDVCDDGRGFQCQATEGDSHLGLSGMEERAALLGGTVHFESCPGKGARVTVRLPCAEENHAADSRPPGR